MPDPDPPTGIELTRRRSAELFVRFRDDDAPAVQP